jgi:SHAQKYF class myb-like DNA-binding protein
MLKTTAEPVACSNCGAQFRTAIDLGIHFVRCYHHPDIASVPDPEAIPGAPWTVDWSKAADAKASLPPLPLAPPGSVAGRWSALEHRWFLLGVALHGRCWKSINMMIPERTMVQVRTHAQKYFKTLAHGKKHSRGKHASGGNALNGPDSTDKPAEAAARQNAEPAPAAEANGSDAGGRASSEGSTEAEHKGARRKADQTEGGEETGASASAESERFARAVASYRVAELECRRLRAE